MGPSVGKAVVNAELIFNHHALPFDSSEAADAAMPDFLRLGFRAQRAGFGVILVDENLDSTWFRVELARGYFWQDWHNRHSERDEYRDLVRAFRSIATHQPLLSPADMEAGGDLKEVCLAGAEESLTALLAAVWHEAPLLGFPTRPPWDRSPVAVTVQTMDPDGEFRESAEEIVNLCSLAVWEENEDEFRRERNAAIQTGQRLRDDWEGLFPALELCGKAPQQLSKWSRCRSLLDATKEALTVLNDFSERWRDGRIPDYSHERLRELGLNREVSGESETVRNNPSLRRHREIWLPSGNKVFFENHVKLPRGFRLHFFPDGESRTIFVGYIGLHLPLK
jgi:hypothetical protein